MHSTMKQSFIQNSNVSPNDMKFCRTFLWQAWSVGYNCSFTNQMNSLWPGESYGVWEPGQHRSRQWLVALWCQAIMKTSVDLPSMRSSRVMFTQIQYSRYPLRRRQMNVMAYRITSQSRVCSAVCYTPCFNEVERGVYWFHLVRLSVCRQNGVRSSDPFNICTSYQATSESVSHVKFVPKIKNLSSSSFDLGFNMIQ